MNAHFSKKEIDRFCAEIRKKIVNEATSDPLDAIFTRIAKEVLPLFSRLLLEEVNRGTDSAQVQIAAGKTMANMVASLCAGTVRQERMVSETTMAFCVHIGNCIAVEAIEQLKGSAEPSANDVMARGEFGGHA
ncbi:hypothetical protein IZ6_07550 [Terrihabitans soli]|uniref:Uncharacterized protein n=1 Tax=Terrihabitans soli TaxID=708113 RepID=A0A6S6QSV8_9HYPH|nr:hypothetical protein [Terrihabitans soli]BCJ90020.1 hypothetical protein IZ6_07550 [Terrihabitans soli]